MAKSKDPIVATICLDENNEVAAILPGNACVMSLEEGEFPTYDYISHFLSLSQVKTLVGYLPKE